MDVDTGVDVNMGGRVGAHEGVDDVDGGVDESLDEGVGTDVGMGMVVQDSSGWRRFTYTAAAVVWFTSGCRAAFAPILLCARPA